MIKGDSTLFLTIIIMDYIFSPHTNKDNIAYVRYLIWNHHTSVAELYPHCSLIPKQHYMIHFPDGKVAKLWYNEDYIYNLYIYIDVVP